MPMVLFINNILMHCLNNSAIGCEVCVWLQVWCYKYYC